MQLLRFLTQTSVANFDMAKLTLDGSEWVFDLGPNLGLHLLKLVFCMADIGRVSATEVAFIAKHQSIYSVVRMCRVLRLHPSGYYAWKAKPQSHYATVPSMTSACWVNRTGFRGGSTPERIES